ncbi:MULTISPECIES: signal peptidase I [Borrelia]|uniref:Signal peptidase I n=2 Tax=Borrelia turicatae TaxID=142 RepID=A0A172XAH7_BORTU|nr:MULTISPECIES: signal peptidase I [Borrelia]AAX17376.1 signal peptidase I [Borrelia turicatae 91E135]ANF33549.1 signal peptidase I [Borrelia turicatae]UPA11744.1 signal peptidase I [Borrelia venezuelensis]UPA12917.1 signal peptidase I [Borrelia turicatae 91E135]UPA14405.1 signal peptidase I [Borrelia turicatae]
MYLEKLDKFANFLVKIIEKYLTYRKKRKYFYKLKAKRRGFMLNFLLELLGASIFVLGINQYFLQAYRIPSGSMENTLQIGDLLFVDKFSYGPELLPGVCKINGVKEPNEAEIVIFENVEYESKGLFFDILHRLLYMLSFSFVDLDRDENGNPSVRFLVKRALFADGKLVRFRNGTVFVRKEGEESFIEENSYKASLGYNFGIKKVIEDVDYKVYDNLAMFIALNQLSVDLENISDFSFFNVREVDRFEIERLEYRYLVAFMPYVDYYMEKAIMRDYGIYVPYGYVLPIGDNRDNSYDGRFFGVINKSKILGRAFFMYFPFSRIGLI